MYKEYLNKFYFCKWVKVIFFFKEIYMRDDGNDVEMDVFKKMED